MGTKIFEIFSDKNGRYNVFYSSDQDPSIAENLLYRQNSDKWFYSGSFTYKTEGQYTKALDIIDNIVARLNQGANLKPAVLETWLKGIGVSVTKTPSINRFDDNDISNKV